MLRVDAAVSVADRDLPQSGQTRSLGAMALMQNEQVAEMDGVGTGASFSQTLCGVALLCLCCNLADKLSFLRNLAVTNQDACPRHAAPRRT